MSSVPQPGWWRRLRHSRGFGVHSPSAYRFIREVLCERLPYYGYELTRRLGDEWPMGGEKSLRLWLRLCARCSPAAIAVCVPASPRDCLQSIASATCPNASFWPRTVADAGLIAMCNGEPHEAREALKAARKGATIYFPAFVSDSDKWLLRQLKALPYGHTFANGAGAVVFVGLHTVPSEHFDVRF
ncbi:MAG: hypothetical protein K2L21_05185 [Muribaculaceae bacterium]|nr:hypothetical protein [Muribaculaceae bacterium]